MLGTQPDHSTSHLTAAGSGEKQKPQIMGSTTFHCQPSKCDGKDASAHLGMLYRESVTFTRSMCSTPRNLPNVLLNQRHSQCISRTTSLSRPTLAC